MLSADKVGDGYFIADRYFNDPAGYMRDICGMDLDEWQEDCANLVKDNDRTAVKAGHGCGKTAIVAGLIKWFFDTRPDPQIVVTANTEKQLSTKTWRELAKWHNKSLTKDWANWSKTAFHSVEAPETWFASAIPWSENNSEAFAGTHEKYVLVIFDEASNIPDIIWEVAEGALTTEQVKFVCFGNPTKNTGRFRECWRRFKHRWATLTVDCRKARYADQKLIQEWIEDYGLDSDFVRVRALGKFPKASSMQFIAEDIVDAAIKRDIRPEEFLQYPLIFGVDVARYGDDSSVIVKRRGFKMVETPMLMKNLGATELISVIVDQYNKERPAQIFIDADGIGAPIYDDLKSKGLPVVEVRSGITSSNPRMYQNMRSEMWGEMREWLKYADLPHQQKLISDLTQIEYGYTPSTNQIQLEKKSSLKGRGLESPDAGDALAITFFPLAKKPSNIRRNGLVTKRKNVRGWT